MATGLRRIDDDTRAVITTAYKYGEMRFEYSSGDLIYLGTHMTQGVATSEDGWIVKKVTYSSGDIVRIETLIGIWDDRASLGWG